MATIKRNKKPSKAARTSPANPRSNRARSILIPRLRVVVALLVVGLLGWGMQLVWHQVAPQINHSEQYLLSAERMSISPQPEWVTADIRSEVLRNAGLEGRLSILDEAFSSLVEDAFVLHPWVASVEKITKTYPAGVNVELTYRKPVAVVEMSGPKGMLLIPIDHSAVHLPLEDVPEIYKRYLPRIQNVVDRPPVGQRWDDPRVTGAAELAWRLAGDWEQLSLVDILPSSRPEIFEEHRYFVYDLMTRGGTRVVWGAAPTISPPGEDDFDAKLARLRNCISEHGPLDTVRSPAIVDVRSELSVTPRTVKKPTEPRTVKKESPAEASQPLIK